MSLFSLHPQMCFLHRWWEHRPASMRQRLVELWKAGQIEFVMGGWVSNDEASTNYMQVINQITEGHEFIRSNFGPSAKPTVGWQIDPFGLSQATATMFSQMCMDSHAAWRISG